MYSFDQIAQELKQKKYKPLYFFTGEESYFIDQLMTVLEHEVLSETDQAFDQIVLYGKDIQVEQIIENAKRFPMIAPLQVVIIKEAQHIKNIESLASYAQNPNPTTVLAIAYKGKSIDGRKKEGKEFLQAIEKSGVYYESKPLYDNQIPDWIIQRCKQKNILIPEKSAILLSEFLGNDLSKIENELSKLLINLQAGESITYELIEQNIGISKDYNTFEFQKIIAQRNVGKALKIAAYFSKNQKEVPLVLTLSTLFSFFSKVLAIHLCALKTKENVASLLKIRPFFAADYLLASKNYDVRKTVEIISLIRSFDAKAKGVDNNTDAGDLVIDLTYQILQ